ncbi:MAG: MFS transporter, partial [Micromonosporaceae bacterium]
VARRTAALGATLAAGSLGGLAASAGLTGAAGIVAAGVAYTGMFLGLGIANPVRSELMHGRVSATERATLLSVDSLMLMCGGTLGAAVQGAIAARWSIGVAWWIAAGVLLAGALLYLSRKRDGSGERDGSGQRHPVGAGVEVHPARAQEADQREAELVGQVDGEGAGR